MSGRGGRPSAVTAAVTCCCILKGLLCASSVLGPLHTLLRNLISS